MWRKTWVLLTLAAVLGAFLATGAGAERGGGGVTGAAGRAVFEPALMRCGWRAASIPRARAIAASSFWRSAAACPRSCSAARARLAASWV